MIESILKDNEIGFGSVKVTLDDDVHPLESETEIKYVPAYKSSKIVSLLIFEGKNKGLLLVQLMEEKSIPLPPVICASTLPSSSL